MKKDFVNLIMANFILKDENVIIGKQRLWESNGI
jgi:hypothetical protein